MKKVPFFVLSFIFLLMVGYSFGDDDAVTEPYTMDKINFTHEGVLSWVVRSGAADALFLTYGNLGGPSTTIQLTLDADTMCVTEQGALPCLALVTSRDALLHGKAALVQGAEKDTTIRVTTIHILGDAEKYYANH